MPKESTENHQKLFTDYAGHDKAYRIKKEQGQHGWDQSAESYHQRAADLFRRIEAGRLSREGDWLELGCGAGNLTIMLASEGLNICGIDIAPEAITWAREKADNHGLTIQFEVASVLHLTQFPDHQFSVILDSHCYHCIIGEDRQTILNEAYRLLEPGGQLFIDTMVGPVNKHLMDGYDPISQCTVFKNTATRYFATPETITSELSNAGFQITWSNQISHEAHGMMQVIAIKA